MLVSVCVSCSDDSLCSLGVNYLLIIEITVVNVKLTLEPSCVKKDLSACCSIKPKWLILNQTAHSYRRPVHKIQNWRFSIWISSQILTDVEIINIIAMKLLCFCHLLRCSPVALFISVLLRTNPVCATPQTFAPWRLYHYVNYKNTDEDSLFWNMESFPHLCGSPLTLAQGAIVQSNHGLSWWKQRRTPPRSSLGQKPFPKASVQVRPRPDVYSTTAEDE